MRKTLCFCLVLICFCAGIPAGAGVSIPNIDFELSGGIKDDTLLIPVRLSRNDISAGAMNIKYDTALLEPLKITKGDGLSDAYFMYNAKYSADTMRLNWVGTNSSEGNVVFELEFKVLTADAVRTRVEISDAVFADSSRNPTPCNINVGDIYLNMLYTYTTFKQEGMTVLEGMKTGVLSVETRVCNSSLSNNDVIVSIATYKADGSLNSVSCYDKSTVNKGLTKNETKNITIDENVSKVSVFYWDTAMQPYSEVWTIRK